VSPDPLDHHALNWDGCLGVGDEGCVDESCYYCHSPLRPPNLRRCAQNIAIAAALCRAWELGRVYGSDPRMTGPEEWKPGCGEYP
jgi:hypothetical protein